jgi:F0F1-type ATP synthase delta subunit
MKAKAQAISNPLASARAVVEKEMMVEFAKDPSRNLPVKNNLIRAVQRKKQPKRPESKK